jgi:hypothetical protein
VPREFSLWYVDRIQPMINHIECDRTFTIQDDEDRLCQIRVTKYSEGEPIFKVSCAPSYCFDSTRMDAIIELFNAAKKWSLEPV